MRPQGAGRLEQIAGMVTNQKIARPTTAAAIASRNKLPKHACLPITGGMLSVGADMEKPEGGASFDGRPPQILIRPMIACFETR